MGQPSKRALKQNSLLESFIWPFLIPHIRRNQFRECFKVQFTHALTTKLAFHLHMRVFRYRPKLFRDEGFATQYTSFVLFSICDSVMMLKITCFFPLLKTHLLINGNIAKRNSQLQLINLVTFYGLGIPDMQYNMYQIYFYYYEVQN